jgi:hypothetical protein
MRALTYVVSAVAGSRRRRPLLITAAYTATWDHRPDLEHSGVACDPDVARRAIEP